MKARVIALSIAALIVAGQSHAQDRRAVAVYDSTQIALDRYTVVKRLGIQDWRSAFSIRSYGDAVAATDALLAEAERVGADGLVNLHCVSQSDMPPGRGYYCYANAIKVKQ